MAQLIKQQNQREHIRQKVVQHSRKLPLDIYTKELIHLSVDRQHLYYRAKHFCLFLLQPKDGNENEQTSLRVLQQVIRLYEQRVLDLFGRLQLPRLINTFQKQQLMKMQTKIKEIVAKEEMLQKMQEEEKSKTNNERTREAQNDQQFSIRHFTQIIDQFSRESRNLREYQSAMQACEQSKEHDKKVKTVKDFLWLKNSIALSLLFLISALVLIYFSLKYY